MHRQYGNADHHNHYHHQATDWYQQYNVQQHPQLLRKWLEYLHALSLERFDADMWSSMLAAHRIRSKLLPIALKQGGSMTFCYKGMKRTFLDKSVVAPLHIVTGNRMRFSTEDKLLEFLFL